jgi:hypothetical protein
MLRALRQGDSTCLHHQKSVDKLVVLQYKEKQVAIFILCSRAVDQSLYLKREAVDQRLYLEREASHKNRVSWLRRLSLFETDFEDVYS